MALFGKRKSREEAFQRFADAHFNHLYQTAYRLTGTQADAEDLVQDVLIKIYPMEDEWRHLESPQAWLRRVMTNLHIDKCRNKSASILRNAQDDEALYALPDENERPDETAERDDQRQRLTQALNTLDSEQKSLVILHLVEGHTLDSLTDVFQLPLGTLKSRLHRSKAQLKKVLQVEPFPDKPR